jgi:hypothetical protein
MLLDLEKAFDTVCRSKLTRQLELTGLKSFVPFIRSYLTSRTQRVRIDSVTSSIEAITYGVPQGSVMGPFLFISYINAVFKQAELAEIIGFADDTSITIAAHNETELYIRANDVMNRIYRWLCSASLALNISKTKYIRYQWLGDPTKVLQAPIKIHSLSCLTPHTPISCDCPTLDQVSHMKYLGIIIDQNLNWKPHIQYIIPKLRFATVMLKKLSRVASARLLRIVYFAFFQSRLQYCYVAYGAAFNAALEPLNLLQKRCIRIVAKSGFREHTRPLFLQSRILDVTRLYWYRSVCLFLRRPYLVRLVSARSPRTSSFQQTIYVRTTRGQRSFYVNIIRILNRFPSITVHMDKYYSKMTLLNANNLDA